MRLLKTVVSWLVVPAALAVSGFGPRPVVAVTIDMVTVGDPGNAADDTGYGAVASAFQIGKYEVTIAQYAEFLNAVAATDTYGLYDTNMGTDLRSAGIVRGGSPGTYTYSVTGPSGTTPAGASSPGDRPITYVNWFDSARFANWMHNGQPTGPQGSGTTETGAYTLNGATSGAVVAVNSGAEFYLPSIDEWYKAAFYKGGGANAGYWTYATQSDTFPGQAIGNRTDPNQANVKAPETNLFTVTGSSTLVSTQNYLTDVGAFTSSASAYGTFDQAGNVQEWLTAPGSFFESAARVGASWQFNSGLDADSFLSSSSTTNANQLGGFRLAAVPVPEPSTLAIAAAGLACGAGAMLRRRTRG